MRKTRALALGAGWPGASLAATLALCACTGPDIISLGEDPSVRYLSPTGNDANDGTFDSPWKTFKYALPLLVPGSTLRLLNGTYETATTGTLNVRCPDALGTGTVPDAIPAKNGTPGQVITVTADSEHLAFVRGNGSVPPISIDSCQNWALVGIHAESQDIDDALTTPDTGSVVVLNGPNDHVMLRRLLALRPNHYKHAQVIRIGDGASDVTVQECEIYDFHESGIEARRSSPLVIARNYLNTRGNAYLTMAIRPPGVLPRGNYGVRLEETRFVYVLNNIAENVSIGFAVEGRDAGVTASAVQTITGNVLRGNIVYAPAAIGFRIDSQCAGANPCDAPHTVSGTELTNDVVYGADQGVSDAGSQGTRIEQLSIIKVARGVSVARELANLAIPAATSTTNTLVAAFQSVAFDAGLDMTGWSFTHCDAAGGYDPTQSYRPDLPTQVKDKVTTPSDLGSCIAYLRAGSALRASNVGASVINEYDMAGQPTSMGLWLPTFAGCGNPIAGVNDDCGTVNVRLHAGSTSDCQAP